jgi:uncharacterized protein (DUF305 family)
MKLEQIKSVISDLTPRERAELNAWLQDWSDDGWDRQMTADAKNGGKLAKLKREAEADAKAGRLRNFPKSSRS